MRDVGDFRIQLAAWKLQVLRDEIPLITNPLLFSMLQQDLALANMKANRRPKTVNFSTHFPSSAPAMGIDNKKKPLDAFQDRDEITRHISLLAEKKMLSGGTPRSYSFDQYRYHSMIDQDHASRPQTTALPSTEQQQQPILLPPHHQLPSKRDEQEDAECWFLDSPESKIYFPAPPPKAKNPHFDRPCEQKWFKKQKNIRGMQLKLVDGSPSSFAHPPSQLYPYPIEASTAQSLLEQQQEQKHNPSYEHSVHSARQQPASSRPSSSRWGDARPISSVSSPLLFSFKTPQPPSSTKPASFQNRNRGKREAPKTPRQRCETERGRPRPGPLVIEAPKNRKNIKSARSPRTDSSFMDFSEWDTKSTRG